MELHGVISFLSTRKPTAAEISRYQAGHLQTVDLTDNTPWEPYSAKFAETELAARANPSVAAVRVTIPRTLVPDQEPAEEEEDYYQQHFQRPPILDERHVSVISRLRTSNALIELTDEHDLAARMVAAINIESDCVVGDGLDVMQDPICTVAEENRWIAGLATKDRGSVITKEVLARRWGIGLDTAHRTLVATTQVGVRKILHPVERRYRTRQTHLRFPSLNTRL